jgi:DNA processing protein
MQLKQLQSELLGNGQSLQGTRSPNDSLLNWPGKSQSCMIDGEERLFLIALSLIEKMGPVKGRTLLQRYGSARSIFGLSRSELLGAGLSFAHQQAISQRSTVGEAEREMRFIEKHQIEILTIHSDDYPKLLREIHDHPLVLFQQGNIRLNEFPSIAIVGTRKPTPHGERITQAFSEAFGSAGFNVISGMAYGIDAQAHRAAVNAGGLTTGVLGHGLGQIYPREHYDLGRKILGAGGGLLTEFSSGVGPDAFNFPARNRIISGLCHATLVVEAQEKGGALITAKMAFDQDRFVYAIPGDIGSPTSRGCNHLIRDQIAKLVLEPEEIIEDLMGVLTLKRPGSQNSLREIDLENSGVEKATLSQGKDWDPIDTLEKNISSQGVSPQDAVNQLLSAQLNGKLTQRKVA